MALAARKWSTYLRNINRFNRLCSVTQCKAFKVWQHPDTALRIENRVIARCIHTTHTLNKTVAYKLSDIGEGIHEVVIKEWFVKVGDRIQQFDNVCEVQSDKAAVTITSRYDGVITKLYYQVNQIALVGKPLLDIEVDSTEDEDAVASNPVDDTKTASKVENQNTQRVKVLTTPAVRRIAAQFKVDLGNIKATGRNGRVLKEDVLSHLNITSDKSNEVTQDTLSVEAISIPVTGAMVKTEILLEDKAVPVTGFTKAMIKSMTEALKIPHFVFSDEYDVTNLVKSRQCLKEVAQKRGVKLTYMPIIIKAASQSLLSYPVLNTSLDSACENLIYKASHNIGVAMDTPNGLVVPVIRNVQNKSIIEIAKELNTLQEKGSKGQLGLNDISGGTFTISNIGIIGGTYLKPVIMPSQVSIGALGKIQVLPRFDSEGNVVKSHVLTACWSADHRVIDGVTMAKFSSHLKEYLEEPYTLLLDL